MNEVVNINSAALGNLQKIIHIGPKRATYIVEMRGAKSFGDIHELSVIRGLGTKRMADILSQGIATV